MSPDSLRPSLLRSPLLWCGLMVLVFLGWAWRDSVGRWAYVGAGPVLAQSQASGVTIWLPPGRSGWECGSVDASSMPRIGTEGYARYPDLFKLRFGRPDVLRGLTKEEWAAFRKTGMLDGREPDPVLGLLYFRAGTGLGGFRMVFIPYWCVMLAAAGVWAGLIYWRYRRMKGNVEIVQGV
ncbi:hypothetical protein [Haloferula sp. BvORR071]|uniref:hypothetical protein n=1 Tax=Haloferula sp. BvORR071 TaxID=1396141 RepID=UPI0005523E54|nr:hypothetical protein [Haloferula sp. BvORR071]